MIRKKTWAGVSAFVAATALVLTACSGEPAPNPAASGDSDEPVTLRWAVRTSQDEVPREQVVADLYMEQQPNVTIELVPTPIDSYANVIRTQLQSGSAPDLIYGAGGTGDPVSLLNYVDAGQLLDLSDAGWADEAVPETWHDLYYRDDQLWAIPLEYAPVPWVVNADVESSLGLTRAETVDDFLDQCADTKAAGVAALGLPGAFATNAGLVALSFAGSSVYAEHPDWNADRATGDTTFADTAGWKDALEVVVDLNEGGCLPEGAAGVTVQQWIQGTAGGKNLSIIAPLTAARSLKAAAAGTDFELGVFPGQKADSSYLFASPDSSVAISASTQHPDAALAFLGFLTTPEARDAFAAASGNLSITTITGESEAPSEFDALEPYLTDTDRSGPQPNLEWPTGAVMQALESGVQGLLTGQATVDDVLAAMDAAWES